MARIPGTTSWEPLESDRLPVEVPGVLVVLVAAPLYFANADRFRSQIDSTLGHLPSRPRVLVLNVVGIHDIDFTGVRAFKDVLDELDRHRVAFGHGQPRPPSDREPRRSGLLNWIGSDYLYSSVDDAVSALCAQKHT